MKDIQLKEKTYSFREKKGTGFEKSTRCFGERRNKKSNEDNVTIDKNDINKKIESGYVYDKAEIGYLDKNNREPDKYNSKKNVKKNSNKKDVSQSRLGKKLEKYLQSSMPDMNSTEYKGQDNQNEISKSVEKTLKPAKKTAAVLVMAVTKMMISFFTSTIGIVSLIIVVISISVVTTIQTTTYNFVVDEEAHVRELMSNVTYEFSQDIEAKKVENGCDVVVSSGQLADWKEIIALWWTLKTHISESESWNNYFSSDDQQDLEYLFYQFNHIEYSVSDTSSDADNVASKKVLKVTISNTPLEELVEHWGLDDKQVEYLNSLLAEEEIWDEILGTTELSRIAYGEIGNVALKYQQWCGDETMEKSNAFVTYCLGQAGLISDRYIQVSSDAAALKEQLQEKGFLKYKGNHEPEEGDVIFLNMNDELKVGIITRIDDTDNVYVTMCGYSGHTSVEEVTISSSSAMIDSYADLGAFFVLGLNNNQGAENVIRVALQFEGVTDDGNNNVIFNTDYYGHEVSGVNYQWCCVFVWDVFRMAGCSEAFYDGGKTAGCEEVQTWGRNNDLLIPIEMAQPGDLILFDWEPNGVPNHIGIVYNINENGTINTIEGNTGFGNNSNGGQVMIRTRARESVLCIIRPEY